MNRKKLVALLALSLVLLACSNEELPNAPSAPSLGEPDVVLNISEPVEDFDKMLSDLRSAKVIRLVTPDFTRTVGSRGVSDNFTLEDSELLSLTNDSLSIALSADYITFTSDVVTEKNREEPGTQYYLVHKSKEYVNEYQKMLRKELSRLAQTRTETGKMPEVDIHSEQALSVTNAMSLQKEHKSPTPPLPSPEQVGAEGALVDTRMSHRPRGTVRIWLLRHSGYHGFQHEIGWQQQDVKKMIADINPRVNVEFYTRSTGFRANRDGYSTLDNFVRYVRDNQHSGYEWSPSVDKDIFVLVSHGAYSDVAGLAFVDTYNIRREYNSQAFAVSGINPVTCLKVLPHELGHVFGARHTDYTWWEGWWIFKVPYYDVMSYKTFPTPYIREPNNRRIVSETLRF